MHASSLDRMNDTSTDSIFETMLFPLGTREFLTSYWGKEFLHLPDRHSAVKKMFSWDLLNSVLEQFPLQPPRLTLYKGGKEVAPREFIEPQPPSTPGMPGTRLRSVEFIRALKNGATLVLNVADDMSAPLRKFTGELERIFRVTVHANLYAGFGDENGFARHWDNHDTLILQVAGRKAWTVYRPTYPHPMKEEGAVIPPPEENPVWEGILEEGSVIHMPRGWWHVACPVGEPCLHLTVGVKSPMGLDLFRWLLNEKLGSSAFRMNIPLWEPAAIQHRYVESLKREFVSELEGSLVERFVNAMDTAMMPRAQFSLPDSARQSGIQLSYETKVRLCCLRKFVVAPDPNSKGRISFKVKKETWQCNAALGTILELLNDGESHAVGELSGAAELLSDAESHEMVDFLKQLVENDILAVEK